MNCGISNRNIIGGHQTQAAAILAWNTRAVPKVKALEWVRGANDYWYAIGVAMYVIWYKMEGYELEHKSTHPTLEAAKAAAQADYESRILAALA